MTFEIGQKISIDDLPATPKTKVYYGKQLLTCVANLPVNAVQCPCCGEQGNMQDMAEVNERLSCHQTGIVHNCFNILSVCTDCGVRIVGFIYDNQLFLTPLNPIRSAQFMDVSSFSDQRVSQVMQTWFKKAIREGKDLTKGIMNPKCNLSFMLMKLRYLEEHNALTE